MAQFLDDAEVRGIERGAVELACGAGEILAAQFGRRIAVEFKDQQQRDPVTAADKAAQAFLAAEIGRRFPGHGVLGEEATEAEQQSEEPARDILWVLDPLDGTTNFLNGLPVFASSIGVLHRGRAVAAALYVPWPAGGGFVLHCRKGGGARIVSSLAGGDGGDGVAARVLEAERPIPNRLVGLPGYFGVANRFAGGAGGQGRGAADYGQHRLRTGDDCPGGDAVCYFRRPADVGYGGRGAGGAGSGGAVMIRFRGERRWHPLDSLVPSWDEKTPTMKELRAWTAPLVAGNRHLAPLIANNVRRRFSLKARLRPLAKVLSKNRGQSRR